MIDEKTVQKVSRLAHLKIEEKDVPALVREFDSILGDFKSLQDIDTEGIEPMISPLTDALELREDRASNEASVEEILSNAPEKKGTLFKVPPVV